MKQVMIALSIAMGMIGTAHAQDEPHDRSTYLDYDDLTWEESHTDGFPEGRTRTLLFRNESGGGAALWRLPKDYVEPRHLHTNGDHQIFVLKGALLYGDERVETGHFIQTPAGQSHGPIRALEKSEFLIWADCPLDLQLVPGD